MNYICRLAQHWEDFRIPELESVAKIQGVNLEISDYNKDVLKINFIIIINFDF